MNKLTTKNKYHYFFAVPIYCKETGILEFTFVELEFKEKFFLIKFSFQNKFFIWQSNNLPKRYLKISLNLDMTKNKIWFQDFDKTIFYIRMKKFYVRYHRRRNKIYFMKLHQVYKDSKLNDLPF
jgi:hypothetical protein